jgi:hypothetical protein
MSKTDGGVKETAGLKLQEKTETAGVPKEEPIAEKSGQSVEKSHEYKMARTLTSDVNLMENNMQFLLVSLIIFSLMCLYDVWDTLSK